MKKKPKKLNLKPLIDFFLYATSACGVVIVFVAIMSAKEKAPVECPQDSVIETCKKECLDKDSPNKLIVAGENYRMICLCEVNE